MSEIFFRTRKQQSKLRKLILKLQMKFNSLLVLGISLALFSVIKCQVLNDNHNIQHIDNNIPEPTHVLIQKQTINCVAQTTIPTTINSPQMLYPVYSSRIQNKVNQNCTIEKLDPQKQYGDYIKFTKQQLGKFQGWPISILDAAYSLSQQTVFALLTNGSLIKSKLRKQVAGKGNQIQNFQLFNYHQTQAEFIWELDEYELFATEGQVYLLKQKQIFKIIISDNSKWGMESIQNGQNINKVHKQGDDLFIVKINTIHKISNGTVSQNLLGGAKLNQKQTQFVDLDIEKNQMFVLCKSQGVLIINMTKNNQLISKYLFESHDYAYKIAVKDNTVLVNFKLYRKTFIGQFFMISSNAESNPPSFKLNKFYYSFDQMRNVILFQNFGLVYSLSEINIFQHSINRNIPFGQIQTSNIFTASYPKILDVIPLDNKNLHYILVEKNGIFVESFGDFQADNLLKSQMKCTFQQSGKYEVTVVYDGFCRANKQPSQKYCSKEETYVFEVNNEKQNRQVQAFNDHMFIVLILAVAFVLVIGAILTYRRITLENSQKLQYLLAQKKKFNQMNQPKNNNQLAEQEKQFELDRKQF